MIYKQCTMTIAKNGATLDEDIYLYRLDKNIELHFTIVNNKYKFDKSDLNNIIAQTQAAYFQVRLYKNADIKYTFAIQPTQDGVAILTITDDLIDDPIEVGEYDFQISLLDADKTSMISMPIVSKQLHVCEPLVSDDATMGKAILGLSTAANGEIKNAFDSEGNYIREIHSNGEIISAQLFNKFEEALETNTKAIKAGTGGGGTGAAYDDSAIKADINAIKTELGTDALTTTAQNIKGAINEVNKKIGTGTGTAPTVNSVEPELMDMPRIYFSEGTLPTSKTATVMKFDYYSKTNEYHGYVDIKCQGNSSMAYPKKNFTIKPYEDKAKTKKLKINFKGWGKQSKFVLKANWIDITHARNVVSARLWGDIIKTRGDYATALPELLRTSPNQGAIDGFPVLVYSNGVYQGRYTLNIPKDKWMSNMDDALDTHCILCGENYVSGCFRALPAINGGDWTDELHDVVPATIKTSWTNAIKFVMNSTDDEFKTNLGNYFDVNSLIDYLLYGIVSTNLDGFGKNQIYFTYDGVHWIASVYDLDSTWGLWWNGQSFVATDYAREDFQDLKPEGGITKQGNLLYLRLQQLFIPQLKTRYAELRKDVLSVSHIIQKFEEFNDVCPKDIVQEDYASTTGGGKFTGIPSKTTNNIQQLRSYIVARLTYVDGYINALQEATPCTNITLDKTELEFTSVSIPDEVINITKNTTKGCIYRGSNLMANTGAVFGNIKISVIDTTTDFIPFTSNNTLTISQPSSTYGCGIVAYDSNKKAISCYTAINTWEAGNTANTVDLTATSVNVKNPPANTAYIRICFNLTDLSNVVLTKKYGAGTISQTLTATVTPTNTTDKVVWSVSPTGFVTVDNGVVTPIKNGTCVITATCGSHSATCNVNVNLPTVACTSIALDKTALQLGTIEGAAPDTETNLLEGLTWKDGQLDDNTGIMGTGTDKCITNIQVPATGLYTLSANANYTYLKMFLFNSNNELIQTDMSGINSVPTSIYVYEPNCHMSISLFLNSLEFDVNNVTLKYVHDLANTPNKDADFQASVIATPSLLTTSGDYSIFELYTDKIYSDVAAIKLGSNIYKLYNTSVTSNNNLGANAADTSITRMKNGYCTKGTWQNKTLFNIAVPSTWGTTKEDIANYIQTNNIAVVMNPSEYLNSADKISSTTINSYQLKPTIQPNNCTDSVEWSTSPTGIVIVNNGLVNAVKNGEAVVTATCGTKSATCNVSISGLSETTNYVTDGLYADYDLRQLQTDATTIEDLSGNNNTFNIDAGTIQKDDKGGLISTTELQITNNSFNPQTANATIEYTIKYTGVSDCPTSAAFDNRSCGINGQGGKGYYMWLGGPSYCLYKNGQSIVNDSVLPNKLVNGQYYHIVVSFTETNASVYINNKLIKTHTHTISGIPTNCIYFISSTGSNGSSNTQTLYSTRFYNKVLSAQEIAQNYEYEFKKLGVETN